MSDATKPEPQHAVVTDRERYQRDFAISSKPIAVHMEVRLDRGDVSRMLEPQGLTASFADLLGNKLHNVVSEIQAAAADFGEPVDDNFLLASAAIKDVISDTGVAGLLYSSLVMNRIAHIHDHSDNVSSDGEFVSVRDLDEPIIADATPSATYMPLTGGHAKGCTLLERGSRTMPYLRDAAGNPICTGGIMPERIEEIGELPLHAVLIDDLYMYPGGTRPHRVDQIVSAEGNVRVATNVVVPPTCMQSTWCTGAMDADTYARYTLILKNRLYETRGTNLSRSGLHLRLASPYKAHQFEGDVIVMVEINIFPVVKVMEDSEAYRCHRKFADIVSSLENRKS